MPTTEPRRIGVSIELKPHAFDPVANPELFEGVLARRIVAFFIDLLILSVPVVFAAMFIFAVGIVTLGLGFLFYALLPPATHAAVSHPAGNDEPKNSAPPAGARITSPFVVSVT